ncbi:MAG TPA: ABC transporter permease [Ktedonobacteraceae bacterium]|nr:ABC transporter permease [Ktedonobacteraceae bacterium]
MQLTNAEISSENVMSKVKKQGQGIASLLTANPKATIGIGIVIFFVLMAIFAPVLTHFDPNAFSQDGSQPPSLTHLLGTTRKGEDVFAQLVYGARISLLVGFASAIGSTLLQVLFGLTSGYFGGVVDDILSVIINVFLVMPGLPLAIVVASFSPVKGSLIITLVLLFTTWSYGARVLRAQTQSLREREFVTASQASGETAFRIIFAEILPNEIALVVSNFVTTFTLTVLAEVALEFLGLGDFSQSSWGVMLFWAQGQQALMGGLWWWFIPPGLCIALLCAGLTFINFGIDELANPRLRHEKPPKAEEQKKAQEEKQEVMA